MQIMVYKIIYGVIIVTILSVTGILYLLQGRPMTEDGQPIIIKLSTQMMKVGSRDFTVELAFTDQSRERGLMYRDKLGSNEGMLFIFPRERQLNFYMKNCLIDLDILYIRETGEIAKIMTMKKPQAGKPLADYYSDVPVKYALELPVGTAGELGLKKGDMIEIPSRVEKIRPEW